MQMNNVFIECSYMLIITNSIIVKYMHLQFYILMEPEFENI